MGWATVIAQGLFGKQRTIPPCDCFRCGIGLLPVPKGKGNSLYVGGETEPLYPTGTDAVIYYAVLCCVRAC